MKKEILTKKEIKKINDSVKRSTFNEDRADYEMYDFICSRRKITKKVFNWDTFFYLLSCCALSSILTVVLIQYI